MKPDVNRTSPRQCLAGVAAALLALAPLCGRASDIDVDGRTSTLVGKVSVSRTGRPDPSSVYSGGFIGDSAGFTWYRSRHYCLKTDLGAEQAREALTLLELAWPQYAAVFGGEPPDAGKMRQTVVMASSRSSLFRAMADDYMFSFSQGGVTQEGYATSFLYAGTPYQTRYILLHEATHLFQYCLAGDTRSSYGFFLEGIADFLSSHVYDPDRGRLTVNVLDRAPIHNHLANGLEEWRAAGRPSFSDLYANANPSRGIAVLLTAFLQSTPAFERLWRQYCRRVVVPDGRTPKERSDALLDELYGGIETLNAPFASWISSLTPSFALAAREFDQEGDTLVSAFPANGEAPAVMELAPLASPGTPFTRDWPHDPSAAPSSNAVFSARIAWRQPPSPGSFAILALGPSGQPPVVTCAISNALTSGTASFAVNGIRCEGISAKRLPGCLPRGVDLELRHSTNGVLAVGLACDCMPPVEIPLPSADARDSLSTNGWKAVLTASEPGIAFTPLCGTTPSGGRLPAGARFEGARARVHASLPRRGLKQNLQTAVPLSRWRVLGPIRNNPSSEAYWGVHSPTRDEGGHLDLGKEYRIDDGTVVFWSAPVEGTYSPLAASEVVNFTKAFGRQANGATAFATCTVESAEERDAVLALGVSGSVQIAVNGTLVKDFTPFAEWTDGNVRADIHLAKGENEILLAIRHKEGVWLLSGSLE